MSAEATTQGSPGDGGRARRTRGRPGTERLSRGHPLQEPALWRCLLLGIMRESAQRFLLRNICYAKFSFTMESILMDFYFYS